MKLVFNRLACALLSLTLVACTGMNPLRSTLGFKSNPTLLSLEKLGQGVAIGQSKDEVLARLGTTRTVVFDSGFEVWLYQAPALHKPSGTLAERLQKELSEITRFGDAEFIILFDPEGKVRKTRLWQPPPPADKKS